MHKLTMRQIEERGYRCDVGLDGLPIDSNHMQVSPSDLRARLQDQRILLDWLEQFPKEVRQRNTELL